jgi:hypothetical protein
MVGVRVETRGESRWKTYAVIGWALAVLFAFKVNLKEIMPENWEIVTVGCFVVWQYFKTRVHGFPANTDGVIRATAAFLARQSPVGNPLDANLTYDNTQVRSLGRMMFCEVERGTSGSDHVVYGYEVSDKGTLFGPVSKTLYKNVDDVIKEIEASKMWSTIAKDRSLANDPTVRALADAGGVSLPGQDKEEEGEGG